MTLLTGYQLERFGTERLVPGLVDEMVEQLKDIDARWEALRKIRDSVAFAKDKDPAMSYVVKAPKAKVYVIDVSFQALKDKSALRRAVPDARASGSRRSASRARSSANAIR